MLKSIEGGLTMLMMHGIGIGILMTLLGVIGGAEVVNTGSQHELFVDGFLIEHLSERAELRMHHPMPREIVLVTNEP